MKIKSVILFIVMAFAFSYLAQISVRAFWIQKNGHLMWFDGQVLGSSDPVVYTYIIRPKPTALPTTIPTATPTPTPAPQSFFDMAAGFIFGTSSSSSSAPAGGGIATAQGGPSGTSSSASSLYALPDIQSLSCFPAGTKILMADNTDKNIEDVNAGDYVMSDDNGTITKTKVLKISHPVRDHYYVIAFHDGTTLRLTKEHPVFTKEGWKSISPDATLLENGNLHVLPLNIRDSVLNARGMYIGIDKITYVPGPIQTYNLESVENSHTFFADGFLVHNKVTQNNPNGDQGKGNDKSSSSVSSYYYSSSSSYHPYSSSSSSRQSSSAVPLCGGITCLATQTCYQNICWEKCVGGTCLGQYECVSGACIPKSGGGYSSYGLALTATPKPTTPPNILYTSSSSSSKSSIISTPIIPPRLTNTPAPTYTPKIGTKYTPGSYAPPALPTPTGIPQNLQGDTSTIIVRQPDHDDVYTNKMVDKIDIAAPVAAAEHVSSAGKKTGNQSSSLAQTENNDQTTTPDNALDITLSLKQKKDANLALRQDQLVIERGKQVVTVAAATNQNGTLTLTQNDVMATLTMSLSIDPATNFLTVNTPNGPMRVSIMPDDAVAIIKQLQVADANKIPSNIVLESRNNQLEYKISATKLQKLLWFMPISIPQEVYVSADTGGLIAVERSAFYNFISLFTF